MKASVNSTFSKANSLVAVGLRAVGIAAAPAAWPAPLDSRQALEDRTSPYQASVQRPTKALLLPPEITGSDEDGPVHFRIFPSRECLIGRYQDLCRVYPSAAHDRGPDNHQVAGYVRSEKIAKAQEASQVNHARDDAKQSWKPLLKSRQCGDRWGG